LNEDKTKIDFFTHFFEHYQISYKNLSSEKAGKDSYYFSSKFAIALYGNKAKDGLIILYDKK